MTERCGLSRLTWGAKNCRVGTATMNWMAEGVGGFLARYLEESAQDYEPFTPSDPEGLRTTLQPGDVFLVEGNNHISGVPRDVDISPYFEVVKPTLMKGVD